MEPFCYPYCTYPYTATHPIKMIFFFYNEKVKKLQKRRQYFFQHIGIGRKYSQFTALKIIPHSSQSRVEKWKQGCLVEFRRSN